jgi:hypothetical protein
MAQVGFEFERMGAFPHEAHEIFCDRYAETDFGLMGKRILQADRRRCPGYGTRSQQNTSQDIQSDRITLP